MGRLTLEVTGGTQNLTPRPLVTCARQAMSSAEGKKFKREVKAVPGKSCDQVRAPAFPPEKLSRCRRLTSPKRAVRRNAHSQLAPRLAAGRRRLRQPVQRLRLPGAKTWRVS